MSSTPAASASRHELPDIDGDHLLAVRDLHVEFRTLDGVAKAINGVDIALDEGETLAILGESGSGKSVTAQAIMGILDMPPAAITGGQILYKGEDLLTMPDAERRKLRGPEISMIFQDALSSLNPVFPVGWQIGEMFRKHRGMNKSDAYDEAVRLMERVNIPAARERVKAYPHQFSGGMRQRIMIAMAIACNPKLLIADEPTTALDVTIQAQILDLLLDLQRERGMALILITHDMGVVAETVERVVVQYAGQQVEAQSVTGLFGDPMHPYTAALLAALPERSVGRFLPTIPGVVPGVLDRPSGCLFNPRCPNATGHCQRVQPPFAPGPRGLTRCHYPLTKGVPQNHPGPAEAAA